jgi:hypothetical protein
VHQACGEFGTWSGGWYFTWPCDQGFTQKNPGFVAARMPLRSGKPGFYHQFLLYGVFRRCWLLLHAADHFLDLGVDLAQGREQVGLCVL